MIPMWIPFWPDEAFALLRPCEWTFCAQTFSLSLSSRHLDEFTSEVVQPNTMFGDSRSMASTSIQRPQPL